MHAEVPGYPAVFMDRDGTLMEEINYCRRPEDVRAIPGAAERLAALRQLGFRTVIVTNQSGIGRGIITPEEYEAVQAELIRQLEGQIDASYCSADHPDFPTPRRKPGTGMVMEARDTLGIDLSASYFIGDKDIDIECGRNAGLRTALVLTGYGERHVGIQTDFVARDVSGALDWILADAPLRPR